MLKQDTGKEVGYLNFCILLNHDMLNLGYTTAGLTPFARAGQGQVSNVEELGIFVVPPPSARLGEGLVEKKVLARNGSSYWVCF